jgi:galactose mutarotase-like enzyme
MTVRRSLLLLASLAGGCGGTPHGRDSHRYDAHYLDAPEINGAKLVILERRTTEPPPSEVVIDRVTVVPGMGFSILQITAYVPGRGEVDLLKAPDVAEAARIYREAPADRNRTTNFGAGIFAPYGGTDGGTVSSDGRTVAVSVAGKQLALPVNVGDGNEPHFAIHGFLHTKRVVVTQLHGDDRGASLDATLDAGGFDVLWPSATKLDFHLEIHGGHLALAVTAHNVGSEPTAASMGWHPYFKLTDRKTACLTMPETVRHEEVTDYDAYTVTHRVQTIDPGSRLDFQGPTCRPLADQPYDDCLMGPATGYSSAPTTVLVDDGLQLRVSTGARCHRCTQIYSPKDSDFVAIEHQCNHNSALDPAWGPESIPILQPGQSQAWSVDVDVSATHAP